MNKKEQTIKAVSFPCTDGVVATTTYKKINDDGSTSTVGVRFDEESGTTDFKSYNPKGFVMLNTVNGEIIEQFIREGKLLEATILSFFIRNIDHDNAVIMSYSAMQEYFNKSRSTLALAIDQLVKRNTISIAKSGNMNVYLINSQLVWNKKNDQRKFSKFSAKVIISESEQENTRKIKKKFSKQIVLK